MKKSDLKRLLKPIVKECLQESLLEDGVLSRVISEVVMGLNSNTNLIREEKKVRPKPHQAPAKRESEALQNLKAQRQEMLDAIGGGNYNGVNLFEGTDPLTNAGSPGEVAAPSSALSGISAKDPGVDISSLEDVFGDTWKVLGNG